MDLRGWLRHRRWVPLGLAVGLGWSVFACGGMDDPEKPENTGTTSDTAPADPIAVAPQAIQFQTTTELERRVEEAEKKIDPFRRAVESDPTNPEKLRTLGRALHEANLKEEALPYLERAAELEPSVRNLLDLAIGYSGAARLDDAERTYERLLELSPDFPIAVHNLGMLAHRRGNYEQAITYLNRALELEPKYLLAQLHLADSFKSSDRPKEAYGAYERVLALEPRNPQEAGGYIDALYKIASLDLKMGAYERAGRFLTELIGMAPNHNKAYYAYGQVLLQMGYPTEAQKAFDKHVQILAAEQPSSAAMGE